MQKVNEVGTAYMNYEEMRRSTAKTTWKFNALTLIYNKVLFFETSTYRLP